MACFSISRWAAWRALNTRRWSRLVSLAMIYLAISITLGVCFQMATSDGHLAGYGNLPAISLLGDLQPEHSLFAAGFIVMSIFVAVALFYRTGHLDSASPGNVVNNLLLSLPILGLPAIAVMAVIPQGSDLGAVHLLAAAVGLGFLALWCICSTILSMVFHCQGKPVDPEVTPVLRFSCYLISAISATLAPILFGIWMTDVRITIYEWSGVSMIFVALIPFFVLFAHNAPVSYDKGDSHSDPLLIQTELHL